MEEPDRLQSMGSQRIRRDLVTNTFIRGKADLFRRYMLHRQSVVCLRRQEVAARHGVVLENLEIWGG